jgi:hypothetical protein
MKVNMSDDYEGLVEAFPVDDVNSTKTWTPRMRVPSLLDRFCSLSYMDVTYNIDPRQGSR